MLRMQPNLPRRKFDDLINEAFTEYLNHEYTSTKGDPEFYPIDTPNRLPPQVVPNGTWRRLIARHLIPHFSN
jgi:hypothetical protein